MTNECNNLVSDIVLASTELEGLNFPRTAAKLETILVTATAYYDKR